MWKSESEESQAGKVGECDFNVLKFLRATDLMFECGLTFSDALRKAESACVNTTSILIYWTCQSIPKDRGVPQRLGARVPVLRFELLGSCLTRPGQSC